MNIFFVSTKTTKIFEIQSLTSIRECKISSNWITFFQMFSFFSKRNTYFRKHIAFFKIGDFWTAPVEHCIYLEAGCANLLSRSFLLLKNLQCKYDLTIKIIDNFANKILSFRQGRMLSMRGRLHTTVCW